MPAINLRQVALFLTKEQHEGLKRLSKETAVPMQIYMRHAISDLLRNHHILPRNVDDEMLSARILGRKKGAIK